MKRLFATVSLVVATIASAQTSLPAYDPNSPGAIEYREKKAAYLADGQKLDTLSLYNEITRLDDLRKSKQALATPDELAATLFKFTDDDMRSWEYASVLKKRGEGTDSLAAFFYGFNQWKTCLLYERQSSGALAKQAATCWQEIMPFFKKASSSGLADATSNIGKMYENGFGVTPSKYAAAEWYVKAAEQFNKGGSRDDALTVLEKSLNLVPDLPVALRLRKAMLK